MIMDATKQNVAPVAAGRGLTHLRGPSHEFKEAVNFIARFVIQVVAKWARAGGTITPSRV